MHPTHPSSTRGNRQLKWTFFFFLFFLWGGEVKKLQKMRLKKETQVQKWANTDLFKSRNHIHQGYSFPINSSYRNHLKWWITASHLSITKFSILSKPTPKKQKKKTTNSRFRNSQHQINLTKKSAIWHS